MDFILDNLAVGNRHDAALPDPRITAMLCVAEELEPPAFATIQHKIPVVDMRPLPPEQLVEAIGWIERHIAREQILVFCNAGVGRSPSIAIGYLCCAHGYGFGEAVEHVARRRPQISPLPGLLEVIERLRSAP
jgi:protein-tyrosine phosphatase